MPDPGVSAIMAIVTKRNFLLLISAVMIFSSSCSRSSEALPENSSGDSLLLQATVVHRFDSTVFYFSYDDRSLLKRVYGESWSYPWTTPVKSFWEYTRDQHGNVSQVKMREPFSMDTLIERTWFNSGMLLSRSVRNTSGEIRDTSIFTYTPSNLSITGTNYPQQYYKIENYISGDNLDSIRVYQGWGGDFNNITFYSSYGADYTYDNKSSPLWGRGAALFGRRFGDSWVSPGKNNIVTGTYQHKYTYHANGRPATDTIVRSPGDTMRVYYRYQ